jgi:hypothetical protein
MFRRNLLPIHSACKLSWVDVMTDGQSAYPSWCGAPLCDPWPDSSFSFLLPDNCFALTIGRFCSFVVCQWSESWRTHKHIILSQLRLLNSLFVASYDSQGLRWKYSNPPPHGALVARGNRNQQQASSRKAMRRCILEDCTCLVTAVGK